jgi:uncharacterized protein (DUF433 family)
MNCRTACLAGGMEIREIAGEYGTKKEDVQAAIEYATKIIANEETGAYA